MLPIYLMAHSLGTMSVPNGRGGMSMGPNVNVLAARGIVTAARRQAAVVGALELCREQLANDVASIEAYNADVVRVNGQALPVLASLTGQEGTGKSDDWKSWWADQEGYVYSSSTPDVKPMLTQFVVNPNVPSHSCFAAGTSVNTRYGFKPIESIQVGDKIL